MPLPLPYPDDRPSPWPTGEEIGVPEAPPTKVWIPETPLLVLGYSQDPETELNLVNARADDVPVYKRRGGGGAVYLDTGCVCVAWRLPKRDGWAIRDYFGAGNALATRAVREAFGIETVPRGISDLAVETPAGLRKILGSSLHMPRGHALYLASILVATPVAKLDRYLRHPSREPDYRAGRSHADFVANLSTLNPAATPEAVKEAIGRAWEELRIKNEELRMKNRD